MFISTHHNLISHNVCYIIWVVTWIIGNIVYVCVFFSLQSLETPFQNYYWRSNWCQPGNCNFLSLGIELLHWVFRQWTNLAERCKLFFDLSLVPKNMNLWYSFISITDMVIGSESYSTLFASFYLELIKSKLPAGNPCMFFKCGPQSQFIW